MAESTPSTLPSSFLLFSSALQLSSSLLRSGSPNLPPLVRLLTILLGLLFLLGRLRLGGFERLEAVRRELLGRSPLREARDCLPRVFLAVAVLVDVILAGILSEE